MSSTTATRDPNFVPGGSVGTFEQIDLTVAHPLTVAILDGSGTQITSFGGGTQYTDGGTPPANPVGPTLQWNEGGTWRTVSTAKPLPVTASFSPSGTQDVNLTKVDSTVFALGQQLAASSLPVVMTAAQISTLTPLSTVTANQGTAGAAEWLVGGGVASGATDSGNPVKVGGSYTTTKPTYTNNQRGNLQLDSRGNLNVVLFGQDTGQQITPLADNADGVAVSATVSGLKVQSRNSVFNGTSWDRMPGDTVGVFVKQATGSNLHTVLDSGTLTTLTNQTQEGGVNISLNAGAVDTGTRRIVQANGAGKTILSLTGSASASGNNTIVAAGTNKLKVFAFSLSTSSTTAITVKFQSGTGGTDLWSVVLQAPTSVTTGANLAVSPPAWLFATASATLLNLNISAAQAVQWSVSYFDEA